MVEEENKVQMPVAEGSKVGAVMVVGAGVSGIQAALDLANSGFKVYLVEKAPAIGGKMAKLDKTFPTNDCSMCILSPKFIECSRNPNIKIITYAEVESVDGEEGNFKVTILKKPRYIDEEKCLGCPTCIEYCPVKIPDAYNENLNLTKCIYIPFAQAVPAIPVIDPETCLYFIKTECQICRPVCKNKAIDFHQQEQKLEIEVGSIILSPGYEIFQPELQSEYGYKRFANVVTSMEFERILSASGPFRGEAKRPSDRKSPKKIAWKVILAKDHDSELEATIFHNDIRAYGKGFERYYERAQNTPGVRYIWSKVSVVREVPGTKNVVIRFRSSSDEISEEEFDLVVLSVGLTSSEGLKELAGKLSVDLNPYGFCNSHVLSPVETSRSGVYVSGVFHGPKDIPDSVTMASGAAALSAQLLSESRGTLVIEKEYPPERDISSEPPRVGVFVCRCGTNIAKGVDVPKVVRYAKSLDDVVYTEENVFACSIDATTHLGEVMKEQGLNRAVVAACTPRTHEPVFQETLREAGLNPYLFEMANIREQCSFVHAKDKAAATKKAQDAVRMAVAKARLLKPLQRLSMDVNRTALVIGGGTSGMVSALSLAEQGFEVHLVEKTEALGGTARKIYLTLEGGDIQTYVQELITKVNENPLIQVYTEANIVEASGFVGNFITTVSAGAEKVVKEITHGITIVATGAEEFKPTEYFYGKDPRVLTLLELEAEIVNGGDRIAQCNTLVIIECVGSRDSERPYCSRVCCGQAVKNALKLKEMNPEMEIYVLYRDMRTYAFKEDYYQKAAEQEVKFIRYELDDKPEVEVIQENGQELIRISVTEPILGQRLLIDADVLALGTGIVPPADNKGLSQLFKVPLNEDGFFLEAHMKLRPVDFATEGIFMCGLAHSPKCIDESATQAQAAAARAATVLVKDFVASEGIICSVNEKICSGCGVCELVCPYKAIQVDSDKRVAKVNGALCKGGGSCGSACLAGVIKMNHFEDEQIMAQIEAFTR